MNTAVAKNFSMKPLVAAVALAMSAGTALAAPPAGALPGMGVLIAVDVPATTTLASAGLYCMGTAPVCGAAATVGQQIWNGSTFPTFPTLVPSIILNSAGAGGRAVIQWGGNTYNALTGPNAETANAAGFNVGKSATLVFTATQSNGAILNIDNSGSPSEIFGQLVANDLAGFVPSLYVANTNGIIVGANATIAVPQGIGLIGASMTGATAIFDFVRNNGTGQSFIDITTGQSKVEVNGSITGDLLNGAPVFNQPATFVLLAGGDVVNTGNVFGSVGRSPRGHAPGSEQGHGQPRAQHRRQSPLEYRLAVLRHYERDPRRGGRCRNRVDEQLRQHGFGVGPGGSGRSDDFVHVRRHAQRHAGQYRSVGRDLRRRWPGGASTTLPAARSSSTTRSRATPSTISFPPC